MDLLKDISYRYVLSIYQFFLELAPSMLLGVVVMGFMNILLKREFMYKIKIKNPFLYVVYASLLGVPLPLCSCSVLPSARLFSRRKMPKPAIASFLTSTPITGIDSIIITYTMMGMQFAIFRPISAFLMGVTVGTCVLLFGEKQKEEAHHDHHNEHNHEHHDHDHNHDHSHSHNHHHNHGEHEHETFIEKVKEYIEYSFVEFLDDLCGKLLFGILLGGVISVVIPQEFFQSKIFDGGIISYLVMIGISLPMYVCATESLPIAVAFLVAGVSPGAVLVFLTAGPVSNITAWIITKDILGVRNFVVYLVSIMIISIGLGYLLDFLVANEGFTMKTSQIETDSASLVFTYIPSAIFGLLFLASLYRVYVKDRLLSLIKK